MFSFNRYEHAAKQCQTEVKNLFSPGVDTEQAVETTGTKNVEQEATKPTAGRMLILSKTKDSTKQVTPEHTTTPNYDPIVANFIVEQV